MAYFYLTLAIILEIVGLTALKECNGFTRLVPTLVFILGLAASFYLESLALRVLPIGMTYAVWAGTGIVGMGLVGFFFYNEEVSIGTLAGMLFIIAGVAMVLNAGPKISEARNGLPEVQVAEGTPHSRP